VEFLFKYAGGQARGKALGGEETKRELESFCLQNRLRSFKLVLRGVAVKEPPCPTPTLGINGDTRKFCEKRSTSWNLEADKKGKNFNVFGSRNAQFQRERRISLKHEGL
jgi:hypothetical protein